jgi:hypothetical protein
LDTLEGAVFDGSGKAGKPVIVNYDALFQRGQSLQKQAARARSTAESRLKMLAIPTGIAAPFA